MLDQLFKLGENKTSVKTEIVAGLTTFARQDEGEPFREEDVGQLVLVGEDGQFVLVAVDALPAVAALVGVAHRAVMAVGRREPGPGFMEPSGLRNAEAVRVLVAGHQVEERDLQSQRQFLLEPEKALCCTSWPR